MATLANQFHRDETWDPDCRPIFVAESRCALHPLSIPSSPELIIAGLQSRAGAGFQSSDSWVSGALLHFNTDYFVKASQVKNPCLSAHARSHPTQSTSTLTLSFGFPSFSRRKRYNSHFRHEERNLCRNDYPRPQSISQLRLVILFYFFEFN